MRAICNGINTNGQTNKHIYINYVFYVIFMKKMPLCVKSDNDLSVYYYSTADGTFYFYSIS